MNFRSLEEFWAFYVNQHSKPSTRRWHFMGTLISIFFMLCSVVFSWWFLFFVPVSGYGFAWYSHFFVEGNVPATFGHPFWRSRGLERGLYCRPFNCFVGDPFAKLGIP
nr:hypothetical protein CFP56_26526 [Quercus suber]